MATPNPRNLSANSQINTPDSTMPTSNAWSSASLNDPTVPTPYLRSIYNSVPADPSIGQSLNGDQVITLWREVRTALDAIDASRIATQNSANEINNLQVELDAARTEEDILHDKIHVQENELISLRAKVILCNQTLTITLSPPLCCQTNTLILAFSMALRSPSSQTSSC